MALQAMWVPGCAVVPEFIGTRGALDSNIEGLVRARFDPSASVIGSGRTGDIDGSELVGHLSGRGAAFRGQARKVNQFHFAIPTPVIRIPGNVPGPDPNRARIDKFFVMFDSQPGARLNQVFVSDGARGPIASIPLDGISGAFGTNITFGAPPSRSNVWVLSTPTSPGPQVFFGVTISVFVQFSGDENQNQIVFRGAGVDFLV